MFRNRCGWVPLCERCRPALGEASIGIAWSAIRFCARLTLRNRAGPRPGRRWLQTVGYRCRCHRSHGRRAVAATRTRPVDLAEDDEQSADGCPLFLADECCIRLRVVATRRRLGTNAQTRSTQLLNSANCCRTHPFWPALPFRGPARKVSRHRVRPVSRLSFPSVHSNGGRGSVSMVDHAREGGTPGVSYLPRGSAVGRHGLGNCVGPQ